MCGRFTLTANPTEIADRFKIPLEMVIDFESNYNVAPSHSVLTVIDDGTKRRAGHLRWGLIPSWAKDGKIGYKMINARSETVDEKPSFKRPLMRQRCLVIADSFYEWKRTDFGKEPHRIMLKDKALFAMAGLWEKWNSPSGKDIYTCTILTTKPNKLVREIHDRMPVILEEKDESLWMDRSLQDVDLLKSLLKPYDSDGMIHYPVSTLVNSTKNNSPELIQPIG